MKYIRVKKIINERKLEMVKIIKVIRFLRNQRLKGY